MSTISKAMFAIMPAGHGHYKCWYVSQATGKAWKATITDMQLIDAVKSVDYPTQAAMRRLMGAIKRDSKPYKNKEAVS